MWTDSVRGYTERIDNDFVLHTPTRQTDVDRIAQFNAAIHGPELAPMTRSLLLDYPPMEPLDQVYVENRDGEIISALCLIPWTWTCEDTPLRVGELGIVGTAQNYRGRGLIRAQLAYFKRRLQERNCVLSNIQGIPYFYRQFGYDYALPLEGGYRLELRYTPSSADAGYTMRCATVDDVGTLMMLYKDAVQNLNVRTERSEAIWRYLISRDDSSDGMYHETWLAENSSGSIQGYMRIPRHHFGAELVIDEAHAARHDAALALLAQAKMLAAEQDKPGIRLNLPASSFVVHLALAHGAKDMGTYAWQIHVPDMASLLAAMSPTLEARLARSPFIGWSGSLPINFYASALTLDFDKGRLKSVEKTAALHDAKISMPLPALVPLTLGYRSLDEIHNQYPDADAEGIEKLLVETLFPKRDSFIHTAY